MPKINAHPEYITEDQMEKVAEKAQRKEDRILIKLLFYTGARISEVLNLRTEDVDFERATIKLPALKRKGEDYKLAVVPQKLLPELKKFCAGKRRGQKLFTVSRQIAYARIRVAGLKAGIKGLYPHLLRDSCATVWSLKGGDLARLQRQLGHKSFTTTVDRYLRFSTADVANEAEKVWGDCKFLIFYLLTIMCYCFKIYI